jgi:glutamate-1-semialdehyde aminotransferase
LAKKLTALLNTAERIAFFKTGSEAVHAAIRVTTRATGRRGIITTGYHGWLHPLQPLIPNDNAHVTQLHWDSPTLLEDARLHISNAACLILSPLPNMPSADIVRKLVEIARLKGAMVIADEVKAGFRRNFPTVTQELGIHADLVVVSKALANGFPLSALCGPNELLGDRKLFRVFSTYASEILSLAAAHSCVTLLENGSYEVFQQRSNEAFESMTQVARTYNLRVIGVPTFFRLEIPPEIDKTLLCRSLYEKGVLYHPLDEVLLSAAHTSEDIATAIAALKMAFDEQL